MPETVALPAIGSRRYASQIRPREQSRVAGVPFTFADRPLGPPKITKAIFAEAVRKVPLLRAPGGRH